MTTMPITRDSNWTGAFPVWWKGLKKTILFDTGRFDSLFMTNINKLGINPESIETVILSHEHPDHVGGLFKFLDINPKVHVYLPESFSNGYKQRRRGLRGRGSSRGRSADVDR